MRRFSFAVIAATALLCLPGSSAAQEDPRKAQAESVFSEGLKLHDANRDADALAKYRQAYGIYPTPNILFAIGRLEQVLGQSLAAIEHLREAMKSPLLHPRNQELGKGYVAELEKKLARVILVGPAGLRVTIAGKERRLPVDGAVDVEPGTVDAWAEEPDGRTYTGKVETLAGAEAVLELKLVQGKRSGTGAPGGPPFVEPPPSGGEPSHATRNVVAGTLAAVGVVGVGVGFGFLAKGNGQISDATAYRDSVDGGACHSRALPSCDRYVSMLDDVQSSRTIATVSFIGGGVFIAAAVATFLMWPKAASSTSSAVPFLTGNAAGLSGTF